MKKISGFVPYTFLTEYTNSIIEKSEAREKVGLAITVD
jgi:hypothetical protein